MRKPTISPVLLVAPALAAGVAGTALAMTARDPGDAFVLDQSRQSPVRPAELEASVIRAPNALPGSGGGRGRSARCTTNAGGELRNPWTCVVRYKSGDVARYRVTVSPDRSWRGATKGNVLVIEGCCAGQPPATG
ncbi:MAG TPA: hypothetical protein VF587_17240 [Solirubrobacteraceae bacterium]|jgi:hypothetical protein